MAFFFKQWGEWAPGIDRDTQDPDWRVNYVRLEASRNFCFLNRNGGQGFHGERFHVMQRFGKKDSGWLLDWLEWRQFPEAADA